jgi:hypothetical protein
VRNSADAVVAAVQSPLGLTDLAAAKNYSNTSQHPAMQSRDDAISVPTKGWRQAPTSWPRG